MAPQLPEEGGWTVVGRSRTTGEAKARNIVLPQVASQPEDETGSKLIGWGACNDFDQQGAGLGRKWSRRKQRQGLLAEAKDEVAKLVEKVESARLAVEASEFYRRFLETWQSKNLSGSLESAADEDSFSHSDIKSHTESIDEPIPCKAVPEGRSSTPVESTALHLGEKASCSATVPDVRFSSGEQLEEFNRQASSPSSQSPENLQEPTPGLEREDRKQELRLDCSQADGPESLQDPALRSERQNETQTLISDCKEADSGLFDVVVYGVGSISGSDTSRCQLAFALLLRQLLPRTDRLLVFDPAFSDVDTQAVERLGCDVISVNEEGRRCVKRPTLFYMPHCEEWMYDNLLAANWRAEQLQRVAILGNSFSSYVDRLGLCSVEKRARMQYIKRVASVLEEVRIHDHGFDNASAFNDMSWHIFNTASTDDLFGPQ